MFNMFMKVYVFGILIANEMQIVGRYIGSG